MPQFDVCRNPSPRTRRDVPYVLVVQADLLDDFATVVVVPMRRLSKEPTGRLNPVFEVDGIELAMSTVEIATLPRTAVRNTIANLSAERDRIIAALDILFTGI